MCEKAREKPREWRQRGRRGERKIVRKQDWWKKSDEKDVTALEFDSTRENEREIVSQRQTEKEREWWERKRGRKKDRYIYR